MLIFIDTIDSMLEEVPPQLYIGTEEFMKL